MEQMRRTPLGETYWNNQGAYREELDNLMVELMPAIGSAETLNGELIRAANRLYWDYCNNGNGNAVHVRYENDYGYGDEYNGDYEIRTWNPFYFKFYQLIMSTLETVKTEFDWTGFSANMDELERMTIDPEPGFEDEDMAVYDYMMDAVIWYVLNHPDKELPASYNRDIVKKY